MKDNFFFIINKLNYSGACLQTLHLINNLKSKNIVIIFVHKNIHNENKLQVIRDLIKKNIRIYYLDSPIILNKFIHKFYIFRYISKLLGTNFNKKKIERLNFLNKKYYPKTIICNSIFSEFPDLINNLEKNRIIYYVHYPWSILQRKKIFSKSINYLNLSKKILCNDYTQISDLKTLGVNKNKLQYFPNRIDKIQTINLSNQNIKKNQIIKKKYLILSSGDISFRKGSDIFLKISQLIKKKRNDIEFVWIGGIKDHNLKDKFLENQIICLGHKYNPIKYFKKADIFLVNSREESGPLSLIENLLINKLVITHKNNLLGSKLLKNFKFLISEKNSPKFFVKKILNCLVNYQKYKKIKFSKLVKDYDIRNNAKKLDYLMNI